MILRPYLATSVAELLFEVLFSFVAGCVNFGFMELVGSELFCDMFTLFSIALRYNSQHCIPYNLLCSLKCINMSKSLCLRF